MRNLNTIHCNSSCCQSRFSLPNERRPLSLNVAVKSIVVISNIVAKITELFRVLRQAIVK